MSADLSISIPLCFPPKHCFVRFFITKLILAQINPHCTPNFFANPLFFPDFQTNSCICGLLHKSSNIMCPTAFLSDSKNTCQTAVSCPAVPQVFCFFHFFSTGNMPCGCYTIPCAFIASTTFSNPAIFAPAT